MRLLGDPDTGHSDCAGGGLLCARFCRLTGLVVGSEADIALAGSLTSGIEQRSTYRVTMEQTEGDPGEITMEGQTTRAASLRRKAAREFKEMAALALYLYICLGAVLLLKAAILQDVGVNIAIWGIAAVKALLLAKFMLVGRAFQLGKRFRDRPLIWPTIYHALMFLILLLALTTIEEIVVGGVRHRPFSDSITHVVGPTVFEGIAVCLVLFLILLPYSAFVCLSDVLGERETLRLFFVDGSRVDLFKATHAAPDEPSGFTGERDRPD